MMPITPEILSSSAQILRAIAWPVAVVGIAFMFRRQIKIFGDRLQRVRYGDFEASFERRLEQAEELAAQIETASAQPIPNREERIPTEAEVFEQLLNASPLAAVAHVWSRVEAALREAAVRSGINLARGRSALYLTRMLHQTGSIDGDTQSLIDDLRDIRNAAAHEYPLRDVSREDALRFREVAETVLDNLARVGA